MTNHNTQDKMNSRPSRKSRKAKKQHKLKNFYISRWLCTLCLLVFISLSLRSVYFPITVASNNYQPIDVDVPYIEEDTLEDGNVIHKEFPPKDQKPTNGSNNEIPIEEVIIQTSTEAHPVDGIYDPMNTSKKTDLNSYVNASHIIGPGDTLYSISLKYYNSSDFVNILGTKNNINNAAVDLKVGNTLIIPNPNIIDVYVVKPKDTVFSITQHYFNRTWYTTHVLSINGINNPNIDLKAGMKIVLPSVKSNIDHLVQPGETLYSIILKHYRSVDFQEHIIEHNKITNLNALKAGSEIEIPNPFYINKSVTPKRDSIYSLEISISSNTLSVHNNGKLISSYRVATGKDSSTPLGSFKVANKIENPWYSPKGIPGGNAQNPLGTRWIGLDIPGTKGTIYGIHGTNDPSSIGKSISQGCIRMNNSDVEFIFNHIPIGTSVTIKK